jgi:hypothetical protein
MRLATRRRRQVTTAALAPATQEGMEVCSSQASTAARCSPHNIAVSTEPLASGREQGPGIGLEPGSHSGMVAFCRGRAWRQPDTRGGRQVRRRPRLSRPGTAGGGRRNPAPTGIAAAAATLQVNQSTAEIWASADCGTSSAAAMQQHPPAAFCRRNILAEHVSVMAAAAVHVVTR